MRKETRKIAGTIIMSLLFVVLLSINGIQVNAATPEASIGKKNYATLQQAINKVKTGQTIKLKKNVKLSGDNYLVIDGKRFTLDLNKKTISYTGENDACHIKNGANVTVKNGTLKVNGQDREAFFYNEATLTLNNVNCKGSIFNEGRRGEYTFWGHTEPATSRGNCLIEGGDFTEPIYNYGYMKIKNGKFTSNTNCIVIKNGTLTIEDGSFKAKESPICIAPARSGYYSQRIEIQMFGGVFRSIKGKVAVLMDISSSYYEKALRFIISGGTIYKSSKGKWYQNIGKVEISPKVFALGGGNLVKGNSKIQNITVKNETKTYTQAQLQKKARSFSIGAKAKGKISYKVTSGTNYISVNKKGEVTIKKGTPVGVYKVKVTAAAVSKYSKAEKEIVIIIKE